MLLFPVIAWYDIIQRGYEYLLKKLLFPVIAWYDIMKNTLPHLMACCCSRLSLGMI